MISLVFTRLFRSCFFFTSSFTSSTATNTTDHDVLANEEVEYEVSETFHHTEIKLFRYDRSKLLRVDEHQKSVFEVLDDFEVISSLNSVVDDHVLEEEQNYEEEDPIRVDSSNCTSISDDNLSVDESISASLVDLDREFPSQSASNLPVTEQELVIRQQQVEEEVDFFYKDYADRMRWFDVLSHDRTCGISRYPILSKKNVCLLEVLILL